MGTAGKPLDTQTQAFFASRFGQGFTDVRIHTGVAAERSARELNALAYTVGNSIVFAAGHFAPQTSGGRRLLAHELAHVLQQRRDTANGNQPGATLQRTPRPEWAATMQALRPIATHRELTPQQERGFVDGLNEAIQATSLSVGAGVVLPVETKPPAYDYRPGHVYFDTELVNPGATSQVCQIGNTRVLSKTCSEGNDIGDAISIGPRALQDTPAYTQSVFDHEVVHFVIGLERRGGAGSHGEWLRAVTEAGPRSTVELEDPIAYAAQFAHIFELSDTERYSVVGRWAESYSHAEQAVRMASVQLIGESLAAAYSRSPGNTKGLREDLSSIQSCYLDRGCKIKWQEGQWAAIANAMYDIRTHLDVLEGIEKPE